MLGVLKVTQQKFHGFQRGDLCPEEPLNIECDFVKLISAKL